jgi:hypothetical protein
LYNILVIFGNTVYCNILKKIVTYCNILKKIALSVLSGRSGLSALSPPLWAPPEYPSDSRDSLRNWGPPQMQRVNRLTIQKVGLSHTIDWDRFGILVTFISLTSWSFFFNTFYKFHFTISLGPPYQFSWQ